MRIDPVIGQTTEGYAMISANASRPVMTQGELLRALFMGWAQRDDAGFKAAAESIIHEERMKNHRLLADDLERLLRDCTANTVPRRLELAKPDIPVDPDRRFPLLDIYHPSALWDSLILPAESEKILLEIAEEHAKRELLAKNGLAPKQRILFYGPPGCGKSLAARVLASALDLPLVSVRFDAVVSSLLGETAANLRRVFEYVSKGRFVVLFDEFDALGKDRDNEFEHGELKRVVNSLLQLMDSFKGDSILVAATNHEGLLDSAIWRRFEALVEFPRPTEQSRIIMLRTFLRGFDVKEANLGSLAHRLNGATGADIELVSIEAARKAVLGGGQKILASHFNSALEILKNRLTHTKNGTIRPNRKVKKKVKSKGR